VSEGVEGAKRFSNSLKALGVEKEFDMNQAYSGSSGFLEFSFESCIDNPARRNAENDFNMASFD